MSKEIFKPDFYHIPTLVASEVKPHESFVFAVIYWYEKMKEGKCFASNQSIAQSLPYKSSVTSVANALNKLEEKGFIQRVFEDEDKTIRKEIKCLVALQVSPTGEGGFTQGLRGVHPQVKGGSPTGEHIRIPSKNTHIDKLKDTAFDSFWSSYPKKVNRKVCQNLWKTKKLNSKLEVILEFVQKAKKTERWELGYIKAPDVFLRNETWEDDLEAYKPIKATLTKEDILNY